jgi:hypothetical protein
LVVTSVSREEAELYLRLLWELGGGYGRALQVDLGEASSDLYVAIRERLRAQGATKNEASEFDFDDVDWAAIRAIAPAIRNRVPPAEFRIVTGFTFEDLDRLLDRANEAIYRRTTPKHAIALQIGLCQVVIPVRFIAQGQQLAAVPDAASWNTVVPRCARDRREEFLQPLRAYFDRQEGTNRWDERAVNSMAELEAWVTEQGRAWAEQQAARRLDVRKRRADGDAE